MKEFIPSFGAGTLTTVLAKINGIGIIETFVLAFLGGIAGYLGKIAIEWIVKKIKNKLR